MTDLLGNDQSQFAVTAVVGENHSPGRDVAQKLFLSLIHILFVFGILAGSGWFCFKLLILLDVYKRQVLAIDTDFVKNCQRTFGEADGRV